MTFNVSPQMRVIALVAGLVALAMPLGFFMLSRQSTSSPPEVKQIKPLYGGKKVSATATAPAPVAKKASAKPGTAAKKHAATPKKHAAAVHTPHRVVATPKPAAQPKPAAKRAAAPAKVPNPNGLPLVIARALVAHPVVVVTLYDPQAKVDAYSVDEARAGARLAHVGFVPLNVLDQPQAAPLMRKLGVLPDPALLVFRRPGDLALRIDGFVDRDTVAQAASNVSAAAHRAPAAAATGP